MAPPQCIPEPAGSGALLSYPDAELRAHVPDLRQALHDEGAVLPKRAAELDA
jgi:nitrate reductase delta subunit